MQATKFYTRPQWDNYWWGGGAEWFTCCQDGAEATERKKEEPCVPAVLQSLPVRRRHKRERTRKDKISRWFRPLCCICLAFRKLLLFWFCTALILSYAGSRGLATQWPAVDNQNKNMVSIQNQNKLYLIMRLENAMNYVPKTSSVLLF